MSEVLENEVTVEGWIDRIANELCGGVFDQLDEIDRAYERQDAGRILSMVLKMIRQPTPLMAGSHGTWDGMLDRAIYEVEHIEQDYYA
jgi:hypothetical protein